MIKSFLIGLFFFGTIASFGQSISTKDFQYYFQVAYDYDIHPPELEYGYPWWFDADSLPVSGIIFLKNDLDVPLEKLNDTAWVAEPSSANAKEIAAFLMPEHCGLMPKYLIAPDSGLTYSEIQVFMDSLLCEMEFGVIQYFSFEGKYSLIRYSHQKPNNVWFCGDGIWRDWLDFRVNKDFKFLIDKKIVHFDSIEDILFSKYTENLETELNTDSWSYHTYTVEILNEQIKRTNGYMTAKPDDPLIEREYLKIQTYKSLFNRYGCLDIIEKYAMIIFKEMGGDNSISKIYSIWSKINNGLLRARNKKDLNYASLFALRQFDKIKYIHIQLPDLITDYEDFNRPEPLLPVEIHLPPTPLPENSEVYKALMPESNDELIEDDTLN